MKSDNFTASDFLPVDASATSRFARMGRVQRFAPHTIVLIEGDFSDGVYVIFKGASRPSCPNPMAAKSCSLYWVRASASGK